MNREPVSPRLWHRLHLATWWVFATVGGVLIYVQFLRVTWTSPIQCGWPLRYLTGEFTGFPILFGQDPHHDTEIHWGGLLGDLVLFAAMIAAPLILTERLARQHFRFSLKGLLGFVTVAALLFFQLHRKNHAVMCKQSEGWTNASITVFVEFCWLFLAVWTIYDCVGIANSRIWKAANSGQTQSPPTTDHVARDD